MDLEQEEALAQEERNVLQEEALSDGEQPQMEPEFVPEEQEVQQSNPNEFVEEPLMDLEQEQALLQEEELMKAGYLADEEPVMEPMEPEAKKSLLSFEPAQEQLPMESVIGEEEPIRQKRALPEMNPKRSDASKTSKC